jgi:hypothetical protein
MTDDGIPHHDDGPRSLKDPMVRERRRAMLFQPHMRPLIAYVERLRRRSNTYVPDFDPLDGGVEARILFLFENPGAAIDPAQGGSGFISRNNDDPFAQAVLEVMTTAGIPRRQSVAWCVCGGTRQADGDERAAGFRDLAELLTLLPRLDTAVLVGAAAGARSFVSRLSVFESDVPNAEIWRHAARARYDGRGTTSQRHFSELDFE